MRAKYYHFMISPSGEITSFTQTPVDNPGEFCKPNISSDCKGRKSVGVFVDESFGLAEFIYYMTQFLKKIQA